MNRAQALSKLNRSDMRNAAAERGMQRLFTWNRAHWIGMVVLIVCGRWIVKSKVEPWFLGGDERWN